MWTCTCENQTQVISPVVEKLEFPVFNSFAACTMYCAVSDVHTVLWNGAFRSAVKVLPYFETCDARRYKHCIVHWKQNSSKHRDITTVRLFLCRKVKFH
jgi:hypothetical protein